MSDAGYHALCPSYDAYREGFDRGEPQLLYRRAIGDLETPLSAYLKLTGNQTGTFLLESVEGGEQLGRYSTIGIGHDLVWQCKNNKAELFGADGALLSTGHDALASLKSLLDEQHRFSNHQLHDDLPPMASGLFGFFSYDFVRYIEDLPNTCEDVIQAPDAYLVRPKVVATFDNVRRELVLVTTVRPSEEEDAQAAYDAADLELNSLLQKLSEPLSSPASVTSAEPDFQSNMTPEEYKGAVQRAKDYIAAGDVFQVVLSQTWSADYDGNPLDVYRQLRRINPSPFLFYLNFEPAVLLGASPEILVRVREGEVTIRPIAGTRRRGQTKADDEALAEELLADEKERAEHLMLLDLGRNDVGRSAEPGTVKPTETFVIERFSHVMHITSNVVGRLRAGLTPLDAMLHGFPAGTLSGAPKIRAMEIIDELEVSARGP
ncbi:MAG: chorismate-binding protein, partial [Pseudomonadota bacterium]